MKTAIPAAEWGVESAASRKTRPILAWAVVGAFFDVIAVVAMVGWIRSGQMKRVPPGPSEVPTWMQWTSPIYQAAGMVAMVVVVYLFLIRPWRREGHITTDGLILLAIVPCVWQDQLINFFQPWFTYNTYLFNLGGWFSHIPGWMSQNGHLQAEPLLWIVPIYVYACFGATVAVSVGLRKVKERWPHLGAFGLLSGCFGVLCVFFSLIEPVWMTLGFYTYPGAIKGLTVFHGRYYQYPIYCAILGAVWVTFMASFRYFRNDRGETLAERGLDQLRVTGMKRTGIRFLALSGAMTTAFMCYAIPGAIIGLYSDPWPKDITSRSYFVHGICGPGATEWIQDENMARNGEYACPGPNVPIPRRNSVHLGPDGKLVVPAGSGRVGDD